MDFLQLEKNSDILLSDSFPGNSGGGIIYYEE